MSGDSTGNGIRNWANHNIVPNTISGILPPNLLSEITTEIKAAPNGAKLDVRGTMGLGGKIGKFETVTFVDKSILVLEAIQEPYIAVAIRRLLLQTNNPSFIATITCPNYTWLIHEGIQIGPFNIPIPGGLDGLGGANGENGVDGKGNDGRTGRPGGDATDGRPGEHGLRFNLPPIFIFVGSIEFEPGASADQQYFNFRFEGLRGGNGGDGGNGGNGGSGGSGRGGVYNAIKCTQLAGDGGPGGAAGSGGRGGDGADGGDGANLYLFAPDPKIFDLTTAFLDGGRPGRGGNPGRPGRSGRGGFGGAGAGWCLGNGIRGRDGRHPNPPDYGPGVTATQSGRREVQKVSTYDVASLFDG